MIIQSIYHHKTMECIFSFSITVSSQANKEINELKGLGNVDVNTNSSISTDYSRTALF